MTVRYSTHPSGLPVRTPRDYIAALRGYRGAAEGDVLPRVGRAFAERWQSAVSVVEGGADVASGAKLHDSVVLRGGVIEPGAVAVRSIVCSGGRVLRKAQVVDQCVTALG